MVNITNINEINKENVLSVNNFENVLSHTNNEGKTNETKKENVESTESVENAESAEKTEGSLNLVLGGEESIEESIEKSIEESINNKKKVETLKTDKETDDSDDSEVIGLEDINNLHKGPQFNSLLQGGKNQDDNSNIIDDNIIDDNIIYNIEYILDDDEKLINPEKVYQNVEKYINNYNSDKIKKYKNDFKQLYQTYSTKNYIIETRKYTTTFKITVIKNDKSKKIVKELIKPLYLFYNQENNILKMKRNISNSRTELLYKYELLVAKISITPEDKKEFEKERSKFIEMLEDYYTYTLYHKKINKIITVNKSNLVLQKEFSVYRENTDYESKILNSDVYSIDNTIIDNINKYNSENLINFNNIMLTLSGKKEKDLNKDKKTLESIKSYIKQRQEIESFTKSLSRNTDSQDDYINYIIIELPK